MIWFPEIFAVNVLMKNSSIMMKFYKLCKEIKILFKDGTLHL